MKKIRDKLSCRINKLNAMWATSDSLKRGLAIVPRLMPAEVYYKFLLASAGIRGLIVLSGGVIKKTKMSLQHPKTAFAGSEQQAE